MRCVERIIWRGRTVMSYKVGLRNFKGFLAQTFRFNIINENDVELVVKDDDVGRDDYIGVARINCAKVRLTKRATADLGNLPSYRFLLYYWRIYHDRIHVRPCLPGDGIGLQARLQGRDTVQVPVVSKSGKQHGFVQVTLTFTRRVRSDTCETHRMC